MTTGWSAAESEQLDRADELRIATRRSDRTLRQWVPIWVVCVGDQTYVRTWRRRDTGWFAHAVTLPQARIQVPGLERDVVVEDVGAGLDGQRAQVDEAYRRKYQRYGSAVDRMVTDDAAVSTLRLAPEA